MRMAGWQCMGIVVVGLAMIGCAAIKTDEALPNQKSATLITTNYHWAFPYLLADLNSWNLHIEQIDGKSGVTVNPYELLLGAHTVIAFVEQGPKGPGGNVALWACRGEVKFKAEAGRKYQMNFDKVRNVPQLQIQDSGSGKIVSSASCIPKSVWNRKEKPKPLF